MTNTLKTSAAALAVILALSGAVHAEGVRVTFAGRSPEAVRADVLKAAREVCNAAVARDVRGAYGSVEECVAATVDGAYADMRQQRPTGALAMADPAH